MSKKQKEYTLADTSPEIMILKDPAKFWEVAKQIRDLPDDGRYSVITRGMTIMIDKDKDKFERSVAIVMIEALDKYTRKETPADILIDTQNRITITPWHGKPVDNPMSKKFIFLPIGNQWQERRYWVPGEEYNGPILGNPQLVT